MPRTSAKVGLGDERCLASRHVGLEPVRLEDLDVLLMAGDGGSLGISIRGGNELRGISMRESREMFCLDRLSQRTVFCTISTAAMYCRPGASARIFSSDMAKLELRNVQYPRDQRDQRKVGNSLIACTCMHGSCYLAA